MTQQDILALINAKIKGQGSAIDIGGALPAILGGLTEQAFKAVSPDSTDMSEADQMQVRKNLGLYYEETLTVRLEYDPDGEHITIDDIVGASAYKVSDNGEIGSNPSALIGHKLGWKDNDLQEMHEITITEDIIKSNSGYVSILLDANNPDIPLNWAAILISGESATVNGVSLSGGIWLVNNGAGYTEWLEVPATTIHKIPSKYLPESDSVQYVAQELTEAQKMQARKNQDLYYDGKEEKTAEATVPTGNYYKLTDDVPNTEDIVSMVINGETVANEDITYSRSQYTPTIAIEYDGYHYGYIIIEYTEVGGGVFLTPGIWSLENPAYDTPIISEVTYLGEVVHQIPAKYIPDMPSDVLMVTATLSYPNYTLDKTYAEVLAAFNAGQLVVLKRSGWILICRTIAGNTAYFSAISFDGKQVLLDTLASDETFTSGQYTVPSTIMVSVAGDASAGSGEGNPYYEFALDGGSVSKTLTMLINGIASKESAGMVQSWSVEKLNGDATFTMNSQLGSYSLTVAATTAGISQAVITFQYTVPGLFGDEIKRISTILTVKVTS